MKTLNASFRHGLSSSILSFSPPGLRDIVRYISVDSPERAVAFGRFLVGHTKRLAEFPEIGRIVPEFGEPEIREIIVRSYRVIYHVDHADCHVDVMRLWHGARGTPDVDNP